MATQFDDVIKFFSNMYMLDEKFVSSVCFVESRFHPYATRYEPLWRYVSNANLFAHGCNTTMQTEVIHQSTSWGLMQVMGSVAREQGFEEPLPMLCLPEHGVEMGCKKLSRLSKLYIKLDELAAAYNAGTPLKTTAGNFVNQIYVDKVMKTYATTS